MSGVLLPRTCPICGRVGPAPCGPCAAALRPGPLLPPPPGVDVVLAVMAYEAGGRELVARLKYRNARSALGWIASRQAEQVRRAAVSIDVVTWVPTTPARRRARGFDQAELLARGLARRLRRPCRRLLERGAGPAQTGRSAAARRAGPSLRLARRVVVPARVLLVDDVVTTGATVAAAARTLRSGGAEFVLVSTVARTPLKRRRKGSETCL